MGEAPGGLLERDILNAPTLLTHQFVETSQHLGTDMRRLSGEIEENTTTVFEDVKAEAIASVEGCQCAVDGLDAAAIAFSIPCGAQQDRDLLGRMIRADVCLYQRDVE